MRLWLTDIAITLALLAMTEVMYRAGRAARTRHDDLMRSQLATVQAASLGLLALILGFTMSMAESRFSSRRQINVAEANAIGTTYLRAGFLPEPERSQTRELLRSYVEARRAYYAASKATVPAATAHAQLLHGELWTRAAAVATAHPDWHILATYIESLNETIDLEASRDLAIEARVPRTIRTLLVLLALVAVGITGYAAGLVGPRSLLSLYIVPLIVALATAVIDDLDQTRAGFISTTDRPMERLQRTLTRASTAAGSPDQNRIDAARDAVMPFWPPM